MDTFPTDIDGQVLTRLVEALTDSGQAISIYDADDQLRYANKTYRDIFLGDYQGPFTFADILRYGAKHGLGVRIDGGDVEALITRTYTRRRNTFRKSFETDLLDGRWFWMDQTTLSNGWVLTVGADITALKHSEKTLYQAHQEALLASRTDLLTGLPNRRYIMELLEQALAVNKDGGTSLCLAVIDLDRFKSINDTHGHDAGDAVLQHFAEICRERLSQADQLGRTGGEEFLLILPDVRVSDAVLKIDAIREAFPPAQLSDRLPPLAYTYSAGVTEALSRDDRSSILYRADRALYAAKAAGRNCTQIGFEAATIPSPVPGPSAEG